MEEMNITFKKIRPDVAPGVRSYDVLLEGEPVGVVSNRQGGYWRAHNSAGHWVSSSFCRSRREACKHWEKST